MPLPTEIQGSGDVATTILRRGAQYAHLARHAIVNGRTGAVVAARRQVISVVSFRFAGDRIRQIDLIIDPAKLRRVRI